MGINRGCLTWFIKDCKEEIHQALEATKVSFRTQELVPPVLDYLDKLIDKDFHEMANPNVSNLIFV
jgi:hypothetical protein